MAEQEHGGKDLHPWLRLLDLELRREEPSKPSRRVGRPRKAFPRRAVHITLTEAELESLDELAATLTRRMGRPVHRGQVIGFLVLRLRNKLQQIEKSRLTEEVNSFRSLAVLLDKTER